MYLDPKKAFDTADHSLLLAKLKYMGLGHNTIGWFKSYLFARAQTCFVNSVYSDKKPRYLWGPQGTILGPLRLSVFINNHITSLKFGKGRMYADDMSITFSSNNVTDLQREMNKDLAHIAMWLLANKLTL